MKILHVVPSILFKSAEGPSHSILNLANAQSKIGIKVALIYPLDLEKYIKSKISKGINLLEGIGKKHLNPWIISQDLIWHIQKKIGNPDIVHFHSVYEPFHCALAKRCRKIGWPYIISPRGGMNYISQRYKYFKKFMGNFLFFRQYVKHAHAVHALCKQESKQIQSLFKIKHIFIVPNGVENSLFNITKRLKPIDLGNFVNENDLIMGFIGRVDIYYKGLDLLLESIALLSDKYKNIQLKLFLVGPFYTKKDELLIKDIVKSLDLQNKILFVGEKQGEEKLRYFLACDVFVHTSRSEGMPLAVLEAMALGRACLVTKGTNMAGIVSKYGGWTCETEVNSIADAIRDIYNSRHLLKYVGKRLQNVAYNNFSLIKIAEQMKKEYLKILNGYKKSNKIKPTFRR